MWAYKCKVTVQVVQQVDMSGPSIAYVYCVDKQHKGSLHIPQLLFIMMPKGVVFSFLFLWTYSTRVDKVVLVILGGDCR